MFHILISIGSISFLSACASLHLSVQYQNYTLKLLAWVVFTAGTVNLLVATDVAQEGLNIAKCNFVVRYNFVSNEIGTTQSKGRARAPNSECYLIVEKSSVNLKRSIRTWSASTRCWRHWMTLTKSPQSYKIILTRSGTDCVLHVGPYYLMITTTRTNLTCPFVKISSWFKTSFMFIFIF